LRLRQTYKSECNEVSILIVFQIFDCIFANICFDITPACLIHQNTFSSKNNISTSLQIGFHQNEQIPIVCKLLLTYCTNKYDFNLISVLDKSR